jgi:hypothetical protein
MCDPTLIKKYGAQPTNIQWTVVRGDTGILKVEFYDINETTAWDTEDWTYSATTYDPKGDFLDELTVQPGTGYVTIIAPASLTANWGSRYSSVVAELSFDLQVTIPAEGEDTIWTPVIGTVRVLGDITPSGIL